MAKPEPKPAIVEGDAAKVPEQIAPGGSAPSEPPQRPTKGTQVVFGGKGPQSPWGQIAALAGAGGKVPYTLVNAAVLAKAQQQGKKPGAGGKPKEEEKKKEEAEKPKEPEIHPAALEEIFVRGEEFTHAGEKARVWAHPDTELLGPRPLVVYLHGIQKPADHPQLNDHIETKNVVHVGMLAKRLIDEGKVEPLLIAAPTYSPDGAKGAELWKKFDLAAFIEDLRKVLKKHGLEIDEEEVSVVGHSGAGCNPEGGLMKIADHGAKFGGHALKALGLADTCCADWAGQHLGPALKKLRSKTIVYSLHRGFGGGGRSKEAYAKEGAKGWADHLGATELIASPDYAPGEGPEITDYRTDGQDPPKRISLKMAATPDAGVKNDADVFVHENEWYDCRAAKKGNVDTHYAMTLNWTWTALQRFYPRTSSPTKHAPDPGSREIRAHKAAVEEAGDDWDSVPAGPPSWKAPEQRPRLNSPSEFADPQSGRFWPARTHSAYGRAVAFIDENYEGHGGGPAADPTAQRHFLAPREGEDGRWLNAGVDLYADFGDAVVAPEQAVIARFDPLWPGVWRLLLHCSSGLVICLGGLDPDSLGELKLAVGDKVRAGQPIGRIGRANDGHAMLHFETYPAGTAEPLALWDSAASARSKVLDPTAYLLSLAAHAL